MPPPPRPARERFTDLLADEDVTAGTFSARRTARPAGLSLDVRGVGPIRLPVTIRQAKELVLVSRPAKFGKGEQTLVDAAVRDTWEVPRSRVTFDKRQWNATLRPILDKLRADLGLPDGCELATEFHAMLVYAPGQFFAPHQDSEKHDDMIGTLVVMLPSVAQGGTLVIEHGGVKENYRGSKDSLTLVAFYADCRHHVEPVTSGYRVVLTFNLLLRGDPVSLAAARTDRRQVEALAACIRDHFDGMVDPMRLVYQLDHEYTERGLSWARLKGSDASAAAAVRAAAEAVDCEVALGLVELHETWNAWEPDRSGRRRRHWYGDDEDDVDPDDYELQDLIDSTLDLTVFLDDAPRDAPITIGVDEEELCAATPTSDLTPTKSSYEGYMGNWGNTLDRWYRRAAIVIWPRRWSFAIRAESSPGWALQRLAELLKAKDLAGAREAAASISSVWRLPDGGEKFLGTALKVARDLDDAELAALLLRPFRAEMLSRTHAPPLARLTLHYGESFARELVDGWFDRPVLNQYRDVWIASLPTLVAAIEAPVASLLVTRAWAGLRETVTRDLGQPRPSHRRTALERTTPAVAGILVAMAITGPATLRDAVVGFLGQDNDDLLGFAVSALRLARTAKLTPTDTTGLDALAQRCADRIEARLARRPRADGDWSIDLVGGCACELCRTLRTFLGDRARRTLEWPIVQASRNHVDERVATAELPVARETLTRGRPYTLVLTKTDALFSRERQARHQDEADLDWLRSALPARPSQRRGR